MARTVYHYNLDYVDGDGNLIEGKRSVKYWDKPNRMAKAASNKMIRSRVRRQTYLFLNGRTDEIFVPKRHHLINSWNF